MPAVSFQNNSFYGSTAFELLAEPSSRFRASRGSLEDVALTTSRITLPPHSRLFSQNHPHYAALNGTLCGS